MITKVIFRRENFIASLLYSIISSGLLYAWFYLTQTVNEKVESTLPDSTFFRTLIIFAALSFFIQKRPGVLKNLIAITSGLILVFIHTIIVLHLLFNTLPDIYDAVFYYECFLVIFFCGLPVYLGFRLI